MKTFRGEMLYTTNEIQKVLGGLGRRMLDYIRNSLKLIPSPLKMSEGHGMCALYPETSVKHLKLIMAERKKGITFRTIKDKFSKETETVFQHSDFLRRQYDLEKRSKLELSNFLMIVDQPDAVIKPSGLDTDSQEQLGVSEDVQMQITSIEIKKEMKRWDGKSIDGLYRIRNKIDKFEQLQVSKRLKKGLKARVK